MFLAQDLQSATSSTEARRLVVSYRILSFLMVLGEKTFWKCAADDTRPHCSWKLSDDREVPEGLLMALVKSLGDKVRGMNSQGLSNSLWASAKLKRVAPQVLTALPELAAQISIKAKDMVPQALSNSFWAFAQLKIWKHCQQTL